MDVFSDIEITVMPLSYLHLSQEYVFEMFI